MKPEEKVVSVSTARKLKEAGFPLDRWAVERCWSCGVYPENCSSAGKRVESLCYGNASFKYETERLPAPDAHEIGELLPGNQTGDGTPYWKITKWKVAQDVANDISALYADEWELEVKVGSKNKFEMFSFEAEARAACWIYLKENNLI